MVNVCHLTSVHPRYDVRILEKECASLAKNGYNVKLVVNDDISDEIKNNVHIISTGFVSNSRFKRILLSKKLIYKKAIEIDSDIYQIHDPELLPVALKLKKRGKKVIFDSHEDVANQIKEKTWIPKIIRGIISFVYSKYEKYIVKKLDAVISVTPQFVERFSKYNKNSILITNYPIINKENTSNNYIDEFECKNDKYICFAGLIGDEWCHDNIIKAISSIDGIRYLLAGRTETEYIEYLKTLSGWSKVDYLGLLPHEKVKELYEKSYAGLALNYSLQIKGKGTLGNTKLFEYMEAKLPVICTDYELWKDIIDKYKCGICVNPLDINEIKKAIMYICSNPDIAKKMGENGRKAVEEHFNWQNEEIKLIELYKIL